jgi:hypothetical protein
MIDNALPASAQDIFATRAPLLHREIARGATFKNETTSQAEGGRDACSASDFG